MPDRVKTNAVRFEPLGMSAPAGAADTDLGRHVPQLLLGCRDLLAKATVNAFANHLTQAAETLLARAERAAEAQSRNRFVAAHEILARRGRELLDGFRGEFIAAHDAAMASLERPLILPVTEDSSELWLVEDDDFERELVIGKLSTRADKRCAQSLAALDQRVAALLEGRLLIRTENPLGPKFLFSAFLTACRRQGADDQVDLVLVQEFARQVTDDLPAIYHEMNRFLAEHGVLPNLPLGAIPTTNRSREVAEPMGGERIGLELPHRAPATPAAPATSPPAATPGGAGAMDLAEVFAKLADRLAEAQALALRPPPQPSKAAAGSARAAAQLIAALTRLQRGNADAAALPGIDPDAAAAGTGELLQRIRATPLAAAARATTTVDLTIMLFDLVLKDRGLADALRAQIDRLRLPILKAAILDQGFFSNRQHPARRFLDGLVGATAAWAQGQPPRLGDGLRLVVDALLEDFDEDVTVFDTQLAALEALRAGEAGRAAVAGAVPGEGSGAHASEPLAKGSAEAADDQIRRHTADQRLPDTISRFLDQQWRRVLIAAHASAGGSDRGWEDAIATMDDLVWSVVPKTTEEDRRRLLDMLPGMLHRLRSGLTAAGLGQAWDPFFAQVVRLHVEAIHPDPARARPPPMTQPAVKLPPAVPARAESTAAPTPRPAPPSMPAATTSPRPPETEASPPAAAPNQPPGDEDAYLRLARGLQVGCWVEFISPRGNRRTMRLTWCSEQRGAYLFSGRQGDDTLMVATTSLADQLRDGSAQVINRGRPAERGTDRALSQADGRASGRST